MATPDNDASKDSAMSLSVSGQETGQPEEEQTPGAEQVTPKKSVKKRRREEMEGKEGRKKRAASAASPVDRPSRERKSVVRYAATAPRSLSATKAVKIQQGPGEKLKDIPNVTFKLSKRRSYESLRILHRILFGRKTNIHFLKRNILQFSGFVWSQNEEKDRSRVREKLNKCNKDRLLDFCDLLDVYTLKVNTKKEEISAKLLEFLESPHATREAVLSEKPTKGKKRRRGDAKGNGRRSIEEASSDKLKMKLKKEDKIGVKKAQRKPIKASKEDLSQGGSPAMNDESKDKEDDAEEASEDSISDAEGEESDELEVAESNKMLLDEDEDDDEKDEHKEPKSKEKSSVGRKVFSTKSRKGRPPLKKKANDVEVEPKVSSEIKTSKRIKASPKAEKNRATTKKDSKDSPTKKVPKKKVDVGSSPDLSDRSKKVEAKGKISEQNSSKVLQEKKRVSSNASKDTKENKKQIATTKPKNSPKKKGKQDGLSEPNTEQLHAVVSEILKEVDFNVATLADIIKQLGAHFNTNLMHRKAEIKGILEEVINNMTDDEDAEEEEDDGGNGGAEEGGEKN